MHKKFIETTEVKLDGVLVLTQPISLTILSCMFFIMFTILVLFLVSNDYTKREQVRGFLVPDKGIVDVYVPKINGIVTKIFVKEGAKVDAGDKLFVVIDQSTNGDINFGQSIESELKSRKKIIEEKLTIENKLYRDEIKSLERKSTRLHSEVMQLRILQDTRSRIVDLDKEQLNGIESLFEVGNASRSDMDAAKKRYLVQKTELDGLRLSILRAGSEIEEVRDELVKRKTGLQQLENKYQLDLSQIDQELVSIQGKYSQVIVSPVAGHITALIANTGQQLDTFTNPILSIVPEGSMLEAHLFVPARAIGFLEAGQQVNIRYEAFPFQKFGLYTARTEQISRIISSKDKTPKTISVDEAVYKVIARIDSQYIRAYGKDIPLRSGMSFTADVILSKRTLFEWLLEPVYSIRGKH